MIVVNDPYGSELEFVLFWLWCEISSIVIKSRERDSSVPSQYFFLSQKLKFVKSKMRRTNNLPWLSVTVCCKWKMFAFVSISFDKM